MPDNETGTGSNPGDNFLIQSYDDTGSPLATPVEIIRSSGQVVISAGGLSVTAGSFSSGVSATLGSTLGVAGLASFSGGITFPNYNPGHVIQFGYDGTSLRAKVDSVDLGAIVTSTTAGAYLPLSGGSITGNLAVGGTTSLAATTVSSLSSSGAITPNQTAGIVGTTTNNNANAGAVGEYLIATNSVDTTMHNGTQINIISLNLTPGDWDVEGTGAITFSNQGNYITATVTLTSLQDPSIPLSGSYQLASSAIFYVMAPTGPLRVSIAAPVPVYLVLSAEFSSGTCTGVGVIRARRVR